MRYTLVVDIDPGNDPIETVIGRVRSGEGRLVYAYHQDAVADVRHVLANSGTPERLEGAARRVGTRWSFR